MSQNFDAVAQINRDNRSVVFETDIALGKHGNDQRAYGCTGNAHWLLYSRHEKAHSQPVYLKLLNVTVLDECVASVAFYVRDSLDYKLTNRASAPPFDNLPPTDVVFVVKDVDVPAHKAYLSVISPVFATMFEGNFREASESRVPIEDAEAENFQAFIDAAYPAKVHPTEKNVLAVLALADRYQVDSV